MAEFVKTKDGRYIARDLGRRFGVYTLFPQEDSFASQYPDLVKFWDYEKNKDIDPKTLYPASGQKFWFKCDKCGESLQFAINHITRISHFCKCDKSLLNLYSIIAKEWCEKENGELTHQITAGSGKIYTWECFVCGKQYKLSITKKIKKRKDNFSNCPSCRKKVILNNSVYNTHRDIVNKYWDYKRNKKVDPKNVSRGSHTKVYMICMDCGNSFLTQFRRYIKGGRCRQCGWKKGAETNTKDKEQFIKEATKKHGNTFKYDRVEYVKALEKVLIGCRVKGHEYFPQEPNSHLRGHGCPKCAGNIKREAASPWQNL